MSKDDALNVLPRRKLTEAEIKNLAEGFKSKKGAEPKNNGVKQHIGSEMIRAAADDAEERLKEKIST